MISPEQQTVLNTIVASIQGMPPQKIQGWQNLGVGKAELIAIETDASQFVLARTKFHGHFVAEIVLTEEIDGVEMSRRARFGGEVSGFLSNGSPTVMGAQLDVDEMAED
jgi:hypothetical protein